MSGDHAAWAELCAMIYCVEDSEHVLRFFGAKQVVPGSARQPMSEVFRDSVLSVDREAIKSCAVALEERPGKLLARLVAGRVRNLGHGVEMAPVDTNLAHANVIINHTSGKDLNRKAKALRDAVVAIVTGSGEFAPE